MLIGFRAFLVRATQWALRTHEADDGACAVCGRVAGPDTDQVILHAHDARNLFTIIAGCASAMSRRADRRLPVEPEFRRLTLALNRADHIIGRLLGAESRIQPERAPIDVSRTVAECADMLERIVGDGIRVKLELAVMPDLVLAEPEEIDRIVLGLAIGARDAMGDGGVLTIRTTSVRQIAHSYIRLTVCDTGPGMPSDVKLRVLSRLPLRFQRGSELGLTAVAHTVHALGGTLQIEGDQGLGTQIDIDLPCVEAGVLC